jgi:hypothetical protein
MSKIFVIKFKVTLHNRIFVAVLSPKSTISHRVLGEKSSFCFTSFPDLHISFLKTAGTCLFLFKQEE